MKSFQDANFLQLANPLKGLQKLAEKHREQFQIPVIGITGSNGAHKPFNAQSETYRKFLTQIVLKIERLK